MKKLFASYYLTLKPLNYLINCNLSKIKVPNTTPIIAVIVSFIQSLFNAFIKTEVPFWYLLLCFIAALITGRVSGLKSKSKY